jgi:beta-lactam-binding protein with PASTA domain
VAAPAAAEVLMPEVTCMNLQAAQNAIQAAGVFFSRSDDATGQGRSQIVDSNWTVVSQSPPAGTPIGEGDAVLSAVKIGEAGDCS